MNKRPDIIIFNPDQWRGDVLGHMGNPAAVTPNLDRLVETEAVSFRNAFCQNPVCTPSRCSFMSGWYPHVRGHRSMKRMLRPPDEQVLLKTLKDTGYHVWWGGKNDLVPGQASFDPYCHVRYASHYSRIYDDVPPPLPLYQSDRTHEWRGPADGDNYYSFFVGKIDKGNAPYYRDWDWAVVEGALKAIRETPKDQPLCLFVAIAYPHPPYGVEEPWFSLIDRTKLPPRAPTLTGEETKSAFAYAYLDRIRTRNWDEPRWDELRAVYYGMCARVDHQFGLILDALRDSGRYDDAAVFFFPDHGDFAGDYGLVEKAQTCFEDSLTRVPFVIKPPAAFPVKPGVCDALVELIDFPATVEEFTGVRMPQLHFGRSLATLLRGETHEHRDCVLCEGGRLPGETWVAQADGNAQSDPAGLYWPRQSLQCGDAKYLSKATMIRTRTHKLIKRVSGEDEFYDLRADPQECRNVIADPAQAGAVRDLESLLLRRLLETSDVVPWDLDHRE